MSCSPRLGGRRWATGRPHGGHCSRSATWASPVEGRKTSTAGAPSYSTATAVPGPQSAGGQPCQARCTRGAARRRGVVAESSAVCAVGSRRRWMRVAARVKSASRTSTRRSLRTTRSARAPSPGTALNWARSSCAIAPASSPSSSSPDVRPSERSAASASSTALVSLPAVIESPALSAPSTSWPTPTPTTTTAAAAISSEAAVRRRRAASAVTSALRARGPASSGSPASRRASTSSRRAATSSGTCSSWRERARSRRRRASWSGLGWWATTAPSCGWVRPVGPRGGWLLVGR